MADSSPHTSIPSTDDPTALARYGRLDVVARLLVEGEIMGQHKSPFKGASVEFTEHRHYYPGDEIRHIDWRAYGKTGKYYVKEFEEETNLRCHLLVDASGSMSYGQSTLSKFEYSCQFAAALGFLLLNQRDAVGLTLFDTDIRDRIEPSTSMLTFQQLTETLQRSEPGAESSLATAFATLISTLKRRCLVVIISDLLDDPEAILTALTQFRHERHELILFHIVAPEEAEFPFARPSQFRNLEQAGHRLLVDPHRLRHRYLDRFGRFCSQFEQLATDPGIDYQRVLTSDPYAMALGSYLSSRARRRRRQR